MNLGAFRAVDHDEAARRQLAALSIALDLAVGSIRLARGDRSTLVLDAAASAARTALRQLFGLLRPEPRRAR